MSAVTLKWNRDTWRLLSTGARKQRQGVVYCHLASTTRGTQQKNGWNPVQVCDWVPIHLVETATRRAK